MKNETVLVSVGGGFPIREFFPDGEGSFRFNHESNGNNRALYYGFYNNGSQGLGFTRPESFVYSSYGSPYAFQYNSVTEAVDILGQQYCRVEGDWVVSSTDNTKKSVAPVYPFSSMNAYNGVNSPRACLSYTVNLLQKEIGKVYLDFADPYDHNNYCDLVFDYSRLSCWDKDKPIGELTLFSMYVNTKSGLNSKWANYTGTNTFSSIPGDRYRVTVPCKIEKGKNPVEVAYVVQWPTLVGKQYQFNLSLCPSDWGWMSTMLSDIMGCIYVSTFMGSQSKIIDGFDPNYNSFSWALGKTIGGPIEGPKNATDAMKMFNSTLGFSLVSCSDPKADVALYSDPFCSDTGCSGYKHAALRYLPTKIGWTSKFAKGPLMTHGDLSQSSMEDIVNPYNTDPDNTYPGIDSCKNDKAHLGVPTLCFSKKPGVQEKPFELDPELFVFSHKEMRLLDAAIDEVQLGLRESFSALYKDWRSFLNLPEIQLSSRLSDYKKDESFEALVRMGEPIKPLVVEKLTFKSEFESVFVYEEISGITERSDPTMGFQELAAHYAHDWLQGYSESHDSIF